MLEGLSGQDHYLKSKCLYAIGHISATTDKDLVEKIIVQGEGYKRLEVFLYRTEINVLSKALWALSNLVITSDASAIALI